MKKVCFNLVFVMCFAIVSGAVAADENSATRKEAADWYTHLGAPEPKDHKCTGGDAPGEIACYSSCGSPSQGHRIFVARTEGSSADGLRFCATNVWAYRNGYGDDPWTLYNALINVDKPGPQCFTLYEKGEKQKGCDPSPLILDNYKNADWSVTEVETKILRKTGYHSKVFDCSGCSSSKNPWYSVKGSGHYGKCGAVYDHEHDIIIGIKKFTEDGHGAVVQPMVVRAYCSAGERRNDCEIVIKPVGKTQTLCMAGFKLEDGKCVPVATECKIMVNCEGWTDNDFEGTQYTKVVHKRDESVSCYQYRCAEENYGFLGDPLQYDANRECVECVSTDTVRKAVDENGICVELKNDEIISEETGKKTVAEKTGIDKLVECFGSKDPYKFKNCVLGIPPKQE